MRLYIYPVCLLLAVIAAANVTAQKKPAYKQSARSQPAIDITAIEKNTEAVQWLSIEAVQTAMKQKPKKVFIDVYTDWCGWCKKMDATTFSNKAVIQYLNENFYSVKLNAERKDTFRFMDSTFAYNSENRAHPFAIMLLNNKLSYPTTVIMEENFANPQTIPGYLDIPTSEKVLKYLGGNIYKTTPWQEFEANFRGTWK